MHSGWIICIDASENLTTVRETISNGKFISLILIERLPRGIFSCGYNHNDKILPTKQQQCIWHVYMLWHQARTNSVSFRLSHATTVRELCIRWTISCQTGLVVLELVADADALRASTHLHRSFGSIRESVWHIYNTNKIESKQTTINKWNAIFLVLVKIDIRY